MTEILELHGPWLQSSERTLGGGQEKLRHNLLEVLRAASEFAMRYDRNSPIHATLNKGFALIGNDALWNGPTGQNNED